MEGPDQGVRPGAVHRQGTPALTTSWEQRGPPRRALKNPGPSRHRGRSSVPRRMSRQGGVGAGDRDTSPQGTQVACGDGNRCSGRSAFHSKLLSQKKTVLKSTGRPRARPAFLRGDYLLETRGGSRLPGRRLLPGVQAPGPGRAGFPAPACPAPRRGPHLGAALDGAGPTWLEMRAERARGDTADPATSGQVRRVLRAQRVRQARGRAGQGGGRRGTLDPGWSRTPWPGWGRGGRPGLGLWPGRFPALGNLSSESEVAPGTQGVERRRRLRSLVGEAAAGGGLGRGSRRPSGFLGSKDRPGHTLQDGNAQARRQLGRQIERGDSWQPRREGGITDAGKLTAVG